MAGRMAQPHTGQQAPQVTALPDERATAPQASVTVVAVAVRVEAATAAPATADATVMAMSPCSPFATIASCNNGRSRIEPIAVMIWQQQELKACTHVEASSPPVDSRFSESFTETEERLAF